MTDTIVAIATAPGIGGVGSNRVFNREIIHPELLLPFFGKTLVHRHATFVKIKDCSSANS
jgi:tRNA U34 5-carboxymethylaminomethyl modifying GTPase MnmE/TrmE